MVGDNLASCSRIITNLFGGCVGVRILYISVRLYEALPKCNPKIYGHDIRNVIIGDGRGSIMANYHDFTRSLNLYYLVFWLHF